MSRNGHYPPRRNAARWVDFSQPTQQIVADLTTLFTERPGAWGVPRGTYEMPPGVGAQMLLRPNADLDVDFNGSTLVSGDYAGDAVLVRPADGSKIDVRIANLRVDQRLQKNSGIGSGGGGGYVNPGASNTGDGLSFRGNDSGVGSFGHIQVEELVTFGTDDPSVPFRFAGGDSGLFVNNCDSMRVVSHTAWGARDAAFYASGTDIATNIEVVAPNYQGCAVGVTPKSGIQGFVVTGGNIRDCYIGVLTGPTGNTHDLGPGQPGVDHMTVVGTSISGCWKSVELAYCFDINLTSLEISDIGYGDDFSQWASNPNPQVAAFWIEGGRNVQINGPIVRGVNPVWAANAPIPGQPGFLRVLEGSDAAGADYGSRNIVVDGGQVHDLDDLGGINSGTGSPAAGEETDHIHIHRLGVSNTPGAFGLGTAANTTLDTYPLGTVI